MCECQNRKDDVNGGLLADPSKPSGPTSLSHFLRYIPEEKHLIHDFYEPDE